MMTRIAQARRGFTLLELSVVLGIIALIAGAGMNMASGAIVAANRISTQERLTTIKLALDSYAKTYGYLPCAADRALLSTNINFGVESRTGTACTSSGAGITITAGVIYGGVPVRSLGLPDNYAGDAWGGKLTYAVTGSLASSASSYATSSGSIFIQNGTRAAPMTYTMSHNSSSFATATSGTAGAARLTGLTNAPATGTTVSVVGGVYKGSYTATNISTSQIDLVGSTFTVTDAGRIEYQAVGSNAAYVVVSHGPDGRGAFPMMGTAVPSGKLCNTSASAYSSPKPCTDNTMTACIDIVNCSTTTNAFFDSEYNDGTQQALYFDDYIVWGSNDVLSASTMSSSMYTSCGTGICEPWCATCTVNFPGGGATAPPATITANPFIYKKILTDSASNCKAKCFWGGMVGTVFVKAP